MYLTHSLYVFCSMADWQFHLLEPEYDGAHRGAAIAAGEVITNLREVITNLRVHIISNTLRL